MRFLNTQDRFTLTSSTVPVEDYPAWDSDSTYNTDDIVIYDNKIYKSLVDSNQNNQPDISPLYWLFVSATNPYKCVDSYINTQTESDNDIVMWFDITKTNGIALFNVEASSVVMELYDKDDNLISTKEESAVTGISNWKDYFFTEFDAIDRFFAPLPYVFQGKIKLTITKLNKAKVGMVIIGYLQDLGITLQGVSSGIDDYSKKMTDSSGNIYLEKGNYRDTLECKVFLYNTDFSTAKQRLVKLRGEPVLWIATDEDTYRELLLYGYYESFGFSISNSVTNELNLTLRGLV